MGTRRYIVRREDFKGAYDPAASYHTGSFVRHGGALWMSLRPVSGATPVEGADWTRYVEKGDQGIQGVRGSSIYSDAGAPTATASVGDRYIDTVTGDLYEYT